MYIYIYMRVCVCVCVCVFLFTDIYTFFLCIYISYIYTF